MRIFRRLKNFINLFFVKDGDIITVNGIRWKVINRNKSVFVSDENKLELFYDKNYLHFSSVDFVKRNTFRCYDWDFHPIYILKCRKPLLPLLRKNITKQFGFLIIDDCFMDVFNFERYNNSEFAKLCESGVMASYFKLEEASKIIHQLHTLCVNGRRLNINKYKLAYSRYKIEL